MFNILDVSLTFWGLSAFDMFVPQSIDYATHEFSDDNECERLKPCSDFCHNSPGSFACSCPFGYTLDIDGRNCLGMLL